MKIHYLEIVASDLDQTCSALEKGLGVSFGPPVAELGSARTAESEQGYLIGVRVPMSDTERTVTRPYWLTQDIDGVLAKVAEMGGSILHPVLEIPSRGKFAIYELGGVEQGLWQL